jgi:hypothetical protein
VIEPADDGALDLGRRVRALQPGLPVICVTMQFPGTTADEFDPVAYLGKPFGVAELETALRLVLPPAR